MQGQWLCLPCVVLEAFQLITLFRQCGLQIQVGTIVGQLQGTVVELREKEGVSPSHLLGWGPGIIESPSAALMGFVKIQHYSEP